MLSVQVAHQLDDLSVTASIEQDGNDFELFVARACRTAATASGVVSCKIQRRRSASIFQVRVGAARQQGSHGFRRTRAHGAMKGRDATLVEGVWIGAGGYQELDGPSLRGRLPSIRVGSVVQRLSA